MRTMIIINEVRNAQSLNSDNTRFDVEIKHPSYGWIPYTLDPADNDTTIDNTALLSLVVSSDYGAYVAPTAAETSAALSAVIRAERNALLADSDWMALTDVAPMPSAWKNYRIALRDLPEQSGFPHSFTWPVKPDES